MFNGVETAVIYSCDDGSFSTVPCGTPGGTISTPLTATQLPNGEVVITHAPVNPTVDRRPQTAGAGLLDGQVFGVDKKLIALGVLAWLVLK